MSGVCFLDTETTGLDPDEHEIWEVGLIVDDVEYSWQLPVDLGRADPRALDIGRFHERRLPPPSALRTDIMPLQAESLYAGSASYHEARQVERRAFARTFRELTWGRHLVGAVVSFDEERLRRLLRACGECPGWHYHLIDVEALAVGFLAGEMVRLIKAGAMPADDDCVMDLWAVIGEPWNSRELSRELGVNADDFDQHTALGDARWAKAIYEKCLQPWVAPRKAAEL